MKHFIVILCFIATCCTLSAQVMNMRSWKKTERDSLDKGLALFEEKKALQALPIFENILSNHPTEEFLKYSYAKCALLNPDKQSDAYRHLSEVYAKNRKTPDIQYYMALAAYYNYNYDEAVGHISNYLNSKRIQAEAKKNSEALKRQINTARYFYTHPTRAKVYNLGSSFNTEFDENMPCIKANEAMLVYTYSGPGRSLNANDTLVKSGRDFDGGLYLSLKQEGEFSAPKSMGNKIDFGAYTSLSLSNDGSLIFLYKQNPEGNGDLYQSELNGEAYGAPHKLKGEVNSAFNDAYCSLSPDGRTLYFSSDRPGGRGGKDIYRASLSSDSAWVNITNLGDSVNTAFDEDAPFIHADGKTLFFSSKGHINMGGYDVFKTTLNLPDSAFKKVENLGSPINSPTDDIYFVLSANAENAYLTSNRRDGRGRNDIYHAEPNFKNFKPSLCLFSGKVFKNDKPAAATIRITMGAETKTYYSSVSVNTGDGAYLVTLPTGREYQVSYSIQNYKPKTVTVDLSDMAGFIEKTKNINFDALLDSIKPAEKPAVSEKTTSAAIEISSTTALTKTVLSQSERQAAKEIKPVEKSGAAPLETNTINIAPLLAEKKIPANTVDSTNRQNKITANRVEPSVKPAEKDEQQLKHKTSPVVADSVAQGHEVVIKQNTEIVSPAKTSEAVAKKDTVPVAINSSPKKELKTDSSSSSHNSKLGSAARSETVNGTSKKETLLALQANTVAAINPGSKHKFDDFEPANEVQEKLMMNAWKYGEISYDSLEFRVQVSAFKNNKHYFFPKLEKFGKIDKVELGDGYKRLMLGGSFKTYGRAFAYAKKIIKAGHDDVFIVVVYKGYRYSVEDLEEVGIFK